MKRMISLVLSILLVLGVCLLPVGAEKEAFQFTRENFPRLDGSTSMVPLGQGIASVLLGESREDASDLITFHRTTQSFRNLQMGECDIVIAAEPKSDVFDEMRSAGFAWQIETIAKEALVFVVNEDNPVDSLTREQVKAIYSGSITNWKEVGGADCKIEAFQRNPSAGSQVMMEKLVMEGEPMMEAPSTYIPQEMGELINSVRSFDNSANAIGYTVFYYASDMQMAKGLKILRIDDVVPCAETIRSGDYPYLNGYYACISAQAAADSPERKLYDWLVSDAGQSLLNLEGYVSVFGKGEAPASGSDVYTDESHYAPNGGSTAVYEDYPCPHDHLEPNDGYGLIYPYGGAQLYGVWYDGEDDFYTGMMQGFFNAKGQRITDPIYTYAQRITFGPWDGDDYFWVIGTDRDAYGFAARDGSFVSELCYMDVNTIGSYVICTRDYEDLRFDVYDHDFKLVADQDDFVAFGKRVRPFDGNDRLWICDSYDADYNSHYYVMNMDGQVLMESDQYVYLDEKGRLIVNNEDWTEQVYTSDLSPVFFGDDDVVYVVMPLNDSFDLVRVTSEGPLMVTDAAGSLFLWDLDDGGCDESGNFYVRKGGVLTLYRPDGTVLLSDIPAEWEYLGGGNLFYESTEDGIVIHSMPEGTDMVIPNASYIMPMDDVYSVNCCVDDNWYEQILTKDMVLSPKLSGFFLSCWDVYTGEKYMLMYDSYGFEGEQRLMTSDGKTEIFRANGSIEVVAGMIQVTNDWAFTCYDMEGNVIFCYPFYGLGIGD